MVAPLQLGDPTEISGYVLRGKLGEGGMGTVYLSHTRGGQPVALKVIRREFAQDPEFLRRFTREVEAARRVHGTYTAAVLDSSVEGPQPWLASSYVPGPSLAHAVHGYGPLPLATVLLLVAGVAEALQSVHAVGVVHRDLKPSNVLLAADGPRVIDFGIARATDASTLTGSNVRLGTPAYMSPEQAEGTAVGPALDVFTLGLVGHFAATGEHPFGEGDGHALMYRIVAQEPDLTACPEPLRPLLTRCLAKDPEERPAPSDVIEECHRIAAVEGTTLARSEGWWLPADVAEEMPKHAVAHLASTDRPNADDPTAPDPGPAPDVGAADRHQSYVPTAPDQPVRAAPGGPAASPTRTIRLTDRDRGKRSPAARLTQRLFSDPHRRAKVTGAVVVTLAVVMGATLMNWPGDKDKPSNSPGWAMRNPDVRLMIPAPPFDAQSDATVFPTGKCANAQKEPFAGSVFVDVNGLEVEANQKDAADKDLLPKYALQYSNCSNGLGRSGWGPKSGFRIVDGHGSWGVVTQRGISAAECRRAATDNKRDRRFTVQQIQKDHVLRSGMGLCILTRNTLTLMWITKDEPQPARDNLPDFTVQATQWRPT